MANVGNVIEEVVIGKKSITIFFESGKEKMALITEKKKYKEYYAKYVDRDNVYYPIIRLNWWWI